MRVLVPESRSFVGFASFCASSQLFRSDVSLNASTASVEGELHSTPGQPPAEPVKPVLSENTSAKRRRKSYRPGEKSRFYFLFRFG